MLSDKMDVLNTEQLRNKPGGGRTSVGNHGLPTNDLFSSKLLFSLFSQYSIRHCKRSMYQMISESV